MMKIESPHRQEHESESQMIRDEHNVLFQTYDMKAPIVVPLSYALKQIRLPKGTLTDGLAYIQDCGEGILCLGYDNRAEIYMHDIILKPRNGSHAPLISPGSNKYYLSRSC